MEVNAVAPTTNYKNTKKGAVIGAALGASSIGYQYGMINANFAGLKNAAYGAKKDRIELLKSIYKSTGLFDMQKTTVSKIVKGAKKAVTSPMNVAKNLCGMALIGAGIGFAVDYLKNQKASKQA
ncbi:MAG: hypothetical protein K6E29_01375 [Cyanobacteria bacterium RUI128]|nr:hypothetical protein [Cyanobacteria bacterium RUI128]